MMSRLDCRIVGSMDSEAWPWVGLILLLPLLCWPLTLAIISVIRDERRNKRKRAAQRREWVTQGTEVQQAARLQPRPTTRDHRYGEAHIALSAAWKEIIRLHGAECRDDVCILPSRRIKKGAAWDAWDLAHDHKRGGVHDYLGPAHKVCNQAEALRRGVTWDGAPSLTDLIHNAQRFTPTPDDPWAPPSPPVNHGAADVHEMQRLIDQYREGVLSRAEFESARTRLLSDM